VFYTGVQLIKLP